MAARSTLPLVLALALVALEARAELYRWTDANGVAHYTSDLNQVPAGQRDLARATVLTGKGSLQRVPTGPPRATATPARVTQAPASPAADERVAGKTEAQWRDEAERLRRRVAMLAEPAGRCEKDRFAWSRGDGGDAYREEQAEAEACSRTESDYAQVQRMLADLEDLAHRSGVPPGWIRE